MAFFQDKRKPVSIYKKGSATEKAQRKMNKAVERTFQGAANIAETAAGGAGLRKTGQAVKKAVIDPVAKPVLEDMAQQRSFLAQRSVNKSLEENKTAPEDREAMAITYGSDSRTVGGNAPGLKKPEKISGHGKVTNIPAENVPVSGEAVAAEPSQRGNVPSVAEENVEITNSPEVDNTGSGIDVHMSENDYAIKDGISAIDQKIASGTVPTPEQAERIQKIKQQAGFMRGGTDRVPVGSDGLPLKKPARSFQAGNLDA